jgi:ribonucleotide reductase beta subunit family protein with ferritin-like domain
MLSPRFGPVIDKMKDELKQIIDDVHRAEFEAIDYIHEDEEELPGVTPSMLKDWVIHCGGMMYRRYGIEPTFGVVKDNPLSYMDDYILISKTLTASQETKSGDYLVGGVQLTEEKIDFDDIEL